MLRIKNHFNLLRGLKSDTFEGCRHIYSVICMSFTELHLRNEDLRTNPVKLWFKSAQGR